MQFSDLEFKTRRDGQEGKHASVQFANGYGASIISGPNFYTSDTHPYELAVLSESGDICYTTPITGDVEGWLNEDDVTQLLEKIEALDPTDKGST